MAFSPTNTSPLSVTCTMDERTNRLKRGHCTMASKRKTEQAQFQPHLQADEFTYAFDEAGHLTQVWLNGNLLEEYIYNQAGQRVRSRSGNRSWSYKYDAAGRLVDSGQECFSYDAQGALTRRNSMYDGATYQYGGDTRLDSVRFLNGDIVRYVYGGQNSSNPLGPKEKYKNDRLVAEYTWLNPFQLGGFRDYENGLEYRFFYSEGAGLNRIELTDITQQPELVAVDAHPKNMAEILYPNMRNPESSSALHRLFGPNAGAKVTLLAGCDQVGTPKIFVREDGSMYKKIFYDSFGNALHDSAPQLFMPVGFAGGLLDSHTSLVRFGYRDYDAKTGRFTAPDPAKDLRGDADLYDYCVDDPVSRVDFSGLEWKEAEHPRDALGKFIFKNGTVESNVPAGDKIPFAPSENVKQLSPEKMEQHYNTAIPKAVLQAYPPAPPVANILSFPVDMVEKVLDEGLMTPETLAQYRHVTAGIADKSGRNDGSWSEYNVFAGEEVLVYVKNIKRTPSMTPTYITVNNKTIQYIMPFNSSKVFYFRRGGGAGNWNFSVNGPTDAYMLEVRVYSRGYYDDNK